MLPDVDALLVEAAPDVVEPLTAGEAERVDAARVEAAAAARVAVDAEREAVETVRVAVRAAADADPEVEVLEAVAMRAGDDALAADELPEAVLPVPVRTTRPTPPRGLVDMTLAWPERVAISRL